MRAFAATAIVALIATTVPGPAGAYQVGAYQVGPGQVGHEGSSGPDPIVRAREAASRVSFTGVIEVRWTTGSEEQRAELVVRSAGGSLLVEGGNSFLASSTSERLVHHESGGWTMLWPSALGRGERPDPTLKYETVEGPGPDVAGRPTTLVEVRQGGLLREQVFLDVETDLQLRRRQLNRSGATRRLLGFTRLDVEESTTAPAEPEDRDDARIPVALEPERLPTSVSAERLADGYLRVGAYKRGDTVQALYSDGIYDLSVFVRGGEVDRSEVGDAAETVSVGGVHGWRYTWPGGEVVVWQAGGEVVSMVSDAPLDQVLTAAAELPLAKSRRPSLVERLRSMARTLIQPLA